MIPLPLPRPTLEGNGSAESSIFDTIGSGVGSIFDRLLEAGGDLLENAANLGALKLNEQLVDALGLTFDDPLQQPTATAVPAPVAASGFNVSLPIVLAGVGGLVLVMGLWAKSR